MNDGRLEYTFLWFIENYSYCWHKNGERLTSPWLMTNQLEKTSWRLSVYPRGWRDRHKGYISLYLGRNPIDDGPKTVSLNYELSFLGTDGSPVCSFVNKQMFLNNIGAGSPIFLRLENVTQDILTVRCRIWKGEGEVHKVAPICTRTRIAVENISFMHLVENFSTLVPDQKKTIEIQSISNKGSVLLSSLFFTRDSCSEGEMIVEITPLDSNYILCKRKISLVDVSGNIIACGEDDNRFDAESKDISTLPLSLTRQIILNKKSEYLPDDRLFLLCECSFFTGTEYQKIEGSQHEKLSHTLTTAVKQASNPMQSENEGNRVVKASAYGSVSEDMGALYKSNCLTDVQLKTEGKSFPAHKVVLCARSPVFKAMLTNDMKEKNNNSIEVDDLADDTVQQMLLFLYSDNTGNLQWNTATKLYYAGDKYQISKLKEVCSSFLLDNMNTTNAGELLDLADTHSDNDLKQKVEDFILGHEKEVFGSKEWELLMEINPILAMATMHLKYKR